MEGWREVRKGKKEKEEKKNGWMERRKEGRRKEGGKEGGREGREGERRKGKERREERGREGFYNILLSDKSKIQNSTVCYHVLGKHVNDSVIFYRPGMVAHCNPSTLGGQDGRITQGQEFKTSLTDMEKKSLISTKNTKLAGRGGECP